MSKTEKAVKDIRRKTRRKFSTEEKIRIVLDGWRGESSIAELCRREGINSNLYYRSSKDFLEAGKKRLSAAQQAIAINTAPGNRLIVFGCGTPSSGIPLDWAAMARKPGINMLDEFSVQGFAAFATQVRAVKRPGDVVVCSIHWGSNWGYDIPAPRRRLAHQLIDEAAVDIVHGHSSYHPLGIEVYRDKLVLYGCGDFINDYEGIGSHKDYRGELSLMYFVAVDPSMSDVSPYGTK